MNKKGFSLIELLVTITIVGVLAAVAVPSYFGHVEKANRTIDIATARDIGRTLEMLVASGSVKFPETTSDQVMAIYVIACKDGNSYPAGYGSGSKMKIGDCLFAGANKGVVVGGVETKNWDSGNSALTNEIKPCFSEGMKSNSRGYSTKSGSTGGWDWYAVQYTFNPSTQKGGVRIFSGEKGKSSDARQNPEGKTNIEKAMGVK